jgi:periplasmic protein CpxP/Spy
MSTVAKNKILTGLVIVLLVANAATITMFWLNRKPQQPPMQKGTPQEFMVKELLLDAKQQEQLQILVKEHRQAAEQLRGKTKQAKEQLFELLKQPAVSDSTKQAAAKAVSVITEELDLLTLNHFQKVRAICNPGQQQKFDDIINEVVRMIGQPRPPMGRPGSHPQGPPPGGPDGERPPPPPQE